MKATGQVIRKRRYEVMVSKYNVEPTRIGTDRNLLYQL